MRAPAAALPNLLLQVAKGLTAERSESGVRTAIHRGFGEVNVQACFYALEGGALTPLCPGAREQAGDVALAERAVAHLRAVLAEREAYLPVARDASGAAELLVLRGQGMGGADAAALDLFTSQVSAALASARAIAEYERRNLELAAIAEVARLNARPTPPELDAFLEALALPLHAGAVALFVPDESGLCLVQRAQHGLLAQLPPQRLGEGMAGKAAELGNTALLRGEDKAAPLFAPLGERFGAAAAVRLMQAGRLFGVLLALREGATPFEARDVSLLDTFGDLLVGTLEQRRLHAESRRQLAETQLLLELARTTSGTLELTHILEGACDFLVKLLDVSNCYIFLYDEQRRQLKGAAASAAHRVHIRAVRIPLEDVGVVAIVARSRRPMAVEDAASSEVLRAPLTRPGTQTPELLKLRQQEFQRIKAMLALPMLSRDELMGVVVVDDERGARSFPATLVELAEATVGQLALSVANARLYASVKESYAALAETRAEMLKRERLAALGELAAIVAHEVRNPLGVIFNAVSALRRQLTREGEPLMLLDIVREEGDRLNAIVGELLDFARPRALSLQPEDLRKVVQESIDATLSQPGQRPVAVEFVSSVDDALPPVPMDQRLIRQALVNVMVNAAQAMPGGGKVSVSARREEREGRALVRIDLRDEGIGISPEIAHRIFEPFFTTKAKGTGLGLAVVKRILEDHDGEVEVSSSLGRGTTFTFRLPLVPESGRRERT